MRKASLILLFLFLTACATQPQQYVFGLPGFFSGLWNGFTAIFALFGSIFFEIRMYAFPNTGISYDFGFIIGLLFFLRLLKKRRFPIRRPLFRFELFPGKKK